MITALGDTKTVIRDENDVKNSNTEFYEGVEMKMRSSSRKSGLTVGDVDPVERRGMVLPFRPFSLAFNHVNYSIDMPAEMEGKGVDSGRLQLLKDVNGPVQMHGSPLVYPKN